MKTPTISRSATKNKHSDAWSPLEGAAHWPGTLPVGSESSGTVRSKRALSCSLDLCPRQCKSDQSGIMNTWGTLWLSIHWKRVPRISKTHGSTLFNTDMYSY